MKIRATGFRQELLVLYYAIRHAGTPLLSKAVAVLALLYLLSPIDLVPDFIPVAGWLDDLIVTPLLLHLSYRLLPAAVVRDSRLRARGQGRRLRRIGLIVALLLIAALALNYWHFHSRG